MAMVRAGNPVMLPNPMVSTAELGTMTMKVSTFASDFLYHDENQLQDSHLSFRRSKIVNKEASGIE
jgi:hypothetical protein